MDRFLNNLIVSKITKGFGFYKKFVMQGIMMLLTV